MNCLNCPNDNDRDYPVCESCEKTSHFKFRTDCRCESCKSVIDWRTLRARKSYLNLNIKDLVAASGCGSRSVCAFLSGDESLNLETVIRISAALGLKPKITFEPIKQETQLKAVA